MKWHTYVSATMQYNSQNIHCCIVVISVILKINYLKERIKEHHYELQRKREYPNNDWRIKTRRKRHAAVWAGCNEFEDLKAGRKSREKNTSSKRRSSKTVIWRRRMVKLRRNNGRKKKALENFVCFVLSESILFSVFRNLLNLNKYDNFYHWH